MNMGEKLQTGRVKIITVPRGEAPLEIRESWVGLILPCFPFSGYSLGGELGLLSGKPVPDRKVVAVLEALAIAILEKEKPEAAEWWKQNGFPRQGRHFLFGLDEVELISGVEEQELIAAGLAALISDWEEWIGNHQNN